MKKNKIRNYPDNLNIYTTAVAFLTLNSLGVKGLPLVLRPEPVKPCLWNLAWM